MASHQQTLKRGRRLEDGLAALQGWQRTMPASGRKQTFRAYRSPWVNLRYRMLGPLFR